MCTARSHNAASYQSGVEFYSKRTEVYTQRFFEDTKDLILMGNLEPNYSDVHIFFNKINIGRQLDVSKS